MRVNWVVVFVAALVVTTAAIVCVLIVVITAQPDETHRRADVALKVFQKEQRSLEELRDWLLAEPDVRGLGQITESSLVVSVLDPHAGRFVQWTPRLDRSADVQQVPDVIRDPAVFVGGLKSEHEFLLRIGAFGCAQAQEPYGIGFFGRFGVCMIPRGPGIPSVFLIWSPHEMHADEFTGILPRGTVDWSRKNPRARYSRSELSDGWHIMLDWD